MSHHFKSPRATPSYLSVRVNEERNKILSLQLLLKRENSFYQFWKRNPIQAAGPHAVDAPTHTFPSTRVGIGVAC